MTIAHHKKIITLTVLCISLSVIFGMGINQAQAILTEEEAQVNLTEAEDMRKDVRIEIVEATRDKNTAISLSEPIHTATMEYLEAAEDYQSGTFYVYNAALNAWIVARLNHFNPPEQFIENAEKYYQEAKEATEAMLVHLNKAKEAKDRVLFAGTTEDALMARDDIASARSAMWDELAKAKIAHENAEINEKSASDWVETGKEPKDTETTKDKTGAAYALALLRGAKTPGQYIQALFFLSLSVVGILALLMMVLGGIVYLTSAGNPEKIKKAKSIISGALTGLALLLCSYVILKLINPDLVRLAEPELEKLELSATGWYYDSVNNILYNEAGGEIGAVIRRVQRRDITSLLPEGTRVADKSRPLEDYEKAPETETPALPIPSQPSEITPGESLPGF